MTHFKIRVNVESWPWDAWRQIYEIPGVGENLLMVCGSCGCEGSAEVWVTEEKGCKGCGYCKNNFCGCDCCGCGYAERDEATCPSCDLPVSELTYDGWRCIECEYCAECDSQHPECPDHCVGCCDDQHFRPQEEQLAREYGGENHSDAFEYMLSYEKKPKEAEDGE